MTQAGNLADLFWATFREPRRAAERLLALDLPMEARWLGLFLVSVLTILFTNLMLATVPVDEVQPWERVWSDVWLGLPIQALSMSILALAVTWIGTLFGGKGVFEDALVMVVWIQGVLLAPQVVQIILFPVAPVLSGLIAIGSVGLFFWMLSHFICVLHGFKSALAAFFGVIGSLVFLAIVFALLFSMLGIFPPGMGS
ncbi:YIP1 family protein [Defluviimonas sp. WL0002]|uniref:YIP1 family protein n=1 Tax=Albidovulum marisflavi TaxID=2984159 RepID=A0ABT2ZFP0_9RHOB|nr:Yip1 family protein [Defluviimonas sp. WL0002]MCV2869939.1 YIP1 family protein [Defluviimonas sp. WL0002]